MTISIGIDVGGTFTDVVAVDSDGAVTTAKAATTPADQSEGVIAGLRLLGERLGLELGALLAATERIVHGTTVATNALLEGKGARVGLLTTEGHRDVIEMREGLKPERYDLRMAPPPPLVPRARRLPVRERLRADGSVETPLDPTSLAAAVDALAEQNVDAVAVCFLHAWCNPAHERAAAAAVQARLQGAFVTASSDVLPQIKEFERFSTTVANAAVGPVVAGYLRRLQDRLLQAGFGGPLFIMLSHGGVASVDEAVRLAAGTALSGPAGGVAAAVALARQGTSQDLITFDMGGTSTDIALVQAGQPVLTGGRGVGEARIALPSLDIVTLGAGGGSIAHVSRAGLLQVGPQSAGADPGPACYGAGGRSATVTDANLILGYLDPASFLGGRRRLDTMAAEAALTALGRPLGLDAVATAAGIHRLVNARMVDGLRVATVRRGVDPRRFALLSFGGAAGLHIASVAAALRVARVLVPLQAAVLSAWGMLNTDLRVEMMRSLAQGGAIDPQALRIVCDVMEQEGRDRLRWFQGDIQVRRSADMRYGEQVSEIAVPFDDLDMGAPGFAAALAEAFHRRHEALFTYALRDRAPVLVNARVSVAGVLPALATRAAPLERPGAVLHRRVHLESWQSVPVHPFAGLVPEQVVTGPAIVESDTTTVLFRPGDRGRFDARGWLELEVAGAAMA
ncbi:hydantoinase/oxoprolinase family protein [Limobrevibacterium gyesilva]|uniref:Hydantoinase/oxoprolinase family protein n=1 Tax=Limobrevibacterium gyesilva TaxID=2991712 RepID=A0AA41YJY9_9PROT|nr:hydantoinase/oxoprolinase family protein [Limobrevibacterium gyesilva]